MRHSLATLLFALAVAATCQAGTVYTFTGITASVSPSVQNQSFRYTAPSFIVLLTNLSFAQLDSCVNCDTLSAHFAVDFNPNNCGSFLCFDSIQFDSNNGNGYVYQFPAGTFAQTGTHHTSLGQNSGTLTVSSTGPPPSAVPEPSTVLMMFAGILLVAFFFVRRPLVANRVLRPQTDER